MSNLTSIIRPQVQHFEPYLPGRSIESVKREHGLKRVIKLASNENSLGPSKKAIHAMAATGKNLFRYPDGGSVALREAIAEHFIVNRNRVIVGAGSDELIEILGKTYLNPGDSIVVSKHAFTRYKLAAELMGAEAIACPMKDYRHDLAAMAEAVRPNTKLVFIANPNNPTGTYNGRAELESFLESIERLNRERPSPVLVVVDEAYYEYAKAFAKDYPDTLAFQKKFDFLVTLRTYSKAHALAGLRLGYGFAHPDIIVAMDRVRPPFNVSLAAQAAGIASLGDKTHIQRSISLVATQRKQVLAALVKLKLPVLPSVGNFVLIKVAPRTGRSVFEALLSRGIIVRSMDEYEFPHHIRVTYGLPAENKLFLKAMTEVFAG